MCVLMRFCTGPEDHAGGCVCTSALELRSGSKEKTEGLTQASSTVTSKVCSLSSGFSCGLWLRNMP